jgi:dGTPase
MWRNQALAPFATLPWQSRGRLHLEPSSPSRSPFQRDRDRIIHSTAFRRL